MLSESQLMGLYGIKYLSYYIGKWIDQMYGANTVLGGQTIGIRTVDRSATGCPVSKE